LQSWRQSESNRIALNYGELLVEVDKLPKTKPTQTFDVPSFSDLAKLAQSLKVLILHRYKRNTHTYLLQVNEAAYRFSLSEETMEEGK
jgi:hypothetical protein